MNQLQSIAKEIALNLNEQVRIWQRLLELSIAQMSALKVQDVHSVHTLLQELELTLLERSRIEVQRNSLLSQIGATLGVPAESVTRELISAHCDQHIAEQIRVAAEELRSLVVELDAIVHRNRTLLEQEMSIIEVVVQGATIDTNANATYGKQGMQSPAPRLRLLDAQV